jgi:hypothetical protein
MYVEIGFSAVYTDKTLDRANAHTLPSQLPRGPRSDPLTRKKQWGPSYIPNGQGNVGLLAEAPFTNLVLIICPRKPYSHGHGSQQ